MSDQIRLRDYSVHGVVSELNEHLRTYIEAQYHIRNERLIRERRKLLEEPGTITQLPIIESTPIYQLGEIYNKLDIPAPVKSTLSDLVQHNVSVFNRPYVHQAKALEEFFKNGNDLVVATGTGSGKTESFLMPIIGQLAVESNERPDSANMPGCRALLLYPMNALVNDQLSRVRKLFGSPQSSAIISQGRGRPVTFGSYTGRTPYPGPRTSDRNTQRIEPLFENHYLGILEDDVKREELIQIGQWPSKDLKAFYGKEFEEVKFTQNGSRRVYRHWDKRLKTQPGDQELLTRHEMQENCPDLLITNYSMLEYMMMRPIERSIFASTRKWLDFDEKNEFILVLDEAHVYRGAGGAEVALLIRRLAQRLEIPRERMRCILTSASLGEGNAAESNLQRFARDLTGLSEVSTRRFALIRGEQESRYGQRMASEKESEALANFNLSRFQNHAVDGDGARAAVSELADSIGWQQSTENEDLAGYLYDRLSSFGPIALLISLVAGTAVALHELEEKLIGRTVNAKKATAALLALATFAKRSSDGRVLLPTRLHLFFRGLPGLYACCNSACSARRDTDKEVKALLGRLHTQPSYTCSCSEQARVYELLTHRECGSAFLRGYIDSPDGDFLWHEQSGPIRDGYQSPLIKVDLLVEPKVQQDLIDECIEVWLDIFSGRLVRKEPADSDGFLKAFIPAPTTGFDQNDLVFKQCPICGVNAIRGGQSQVMDHATRGEAPFANLVKSQLDAQPAVRTETRKLPNGGRKVLLFSDGRQKAARLARDIPREVEQDTFRQIISLSIQRLEQINREPRPRRELYITFLSVLRDLNLSIFDRRDAQLVETEISRLDKDYSTDDLTELLVEFDPIDIPSRYQRALLAQMCGRYYSLSGVTAGFLVPSQRAMSALSQATKEASILLTTDDLHCLAVAWIAGMADGYAIDPDLSDPIRASAAGYWRQAWGSDGKFRTRTRSILLSILDLDQAQFEKLELILRNTFSRQHMNGGYFVEKDKIKFHLDLGHCWIQCSDCTNLMPSSFQGHCVFCGSLSLEELKPQQSDYIRARKGFWRKPLEQILNNKPQIRGISVEEHTAQLSHRDTGRIHATTEQYELRFRDIQIKENDRPIDVLSCTTTMEVGVDIGSLVAIGLRNVPPQRENYQQRAGRAGRRGSSISTVLTYCQNGPHDSYYFFNPQLITAGPPREPEVKIDNPKIARRHINSYLFQTFFHEYMDTNNILVGGATSVLSRALGKTADFFLGTGAKDLDLQSFSDWIDTRVISASGDLAVRISEWLPESLRTEPLSRNRWISDSALHLVSELKRLESRVRAAFEESGQVEGNTENQNAEESEITEQEELLEFLFSHGLLPSYAFPTDLTSFLIERLEKNRNDEWKVVVDERPQQGIEKALSEYAPGRQIVINKETYRSGGVASNVLPIEPNRAEPLFRNSRILIHCERCSYIQDLDYDELGSGTCPVCSSTLSSQRMIVPEVFLPEEGRAVREDDREQEITYATMAQFPVPVGTDDLPRLREVGARLTYVVATDRKLVAVNKGPKAEESFGGFWVCEKCGASTVNDPPQQSHTRPYKIESSYSRPRANTTCNGNFANVFLGHVFTSDLLLLRLTVSSPVITQTRSTIALYTLGDALYSIAEGLRLAASRHPQLDLDPAEFGSGFRIVPNVDGDEVHLDIYLYDTLSGGAGYAELAGTHLKEILDDVLVLLENCPSDCERSCQNCLRHYYNQHLQERLDRSLGAELLRYSISGTINVEQNVVEQAAELRQLKRLLELDGFSCVASPKVSGIPVPLIVDGSGKRVAIGVRPGLIDPDHTPHSLSRLDGQPDMSVKILNSYLLHRNLPSAHRSIRPLLD